jgi:single-stranded-DNA-specific exonuclease
MLARRGVDDASGAEAFLSPDLEQLHAPEELCGMREAVSRLLAAREAGEGVLLVGDYDVDGVSGSALLVAVFSACGLAVETILPDRMREGYGFQPVHVERASAGGARVIVTVDCGTTSYEATAAALALGIDVIVTDHHLPDRPLPDGAILVNPHQPACRYPFKELSGAGLALKLGLAFAAVCDRAVDPRILLRVACLGTIADLVPLRDENRVIASIGLQELGRVRSPGLKALIDVSRVEPPFSTADVGYRLGPRLNAPGRLDSATKSLELLLCRDPERARSLAEELDRFNRERQSEERRVVDEARQDFDGRQPLPAILVAWSEGWHRGVVGVAAGRLARDFNRPVILLAAAGGTATGSGRSIDGIHLHDFLSGWHDDLERFGGHSQAIGMTVETRRLEELRSAWEHAAHAWEDRVAVRRFEYELELEPRQVSAELLEQLARFEPHGQGNPRPLIRFRGPLLLPWKARTFGKGHLSAVAAGPDGVRIRLLGWGWEQRSAALEGEFEALGFLENDRFRGTVLRLVDCRGYRLDDEPSPLSEPAAARGA